MRRIGRLHTINRWDCRRWVAERFSVQRMVDDYLKVYHTIPVMQRAAALWLGRQAERETKEKSLLLARNAAGLGNFNGADHQAAQYQQNSDHNSRAIRCLSRIPKRL